MVTDSGEVLYTRADIEKGRQVWQSIGGQQLGSIWGHGSYVAPDWSADWLHREAVAWLESRARHSIGEPYEQLGRDDAGAAHARLKPRIRATATTRPPTRSRSPTSAAAIGRSRRTTGLFGDDPALHELRKAYAMKEGTVPDAENRRALTAFIWWTAWAAVTERPGGTATYTNNWPHEPLVGNTPPSHLLMWTVFSVLFLIAGIALLGWHHARDKARKRRRRCRRAIRSR